MVKLRSGETHPNSYGHVERWTGTRGLAGTKAPDPCKVPVRGRSLLGPFVATRTVHWKVKPTQRKSSGFPFFGGTY